MSRIGVIFTAYQMEDHLTQSLAPWIAARTSRLDDHEFLICAVNVPFSGFPQDGVRDKTTELLRGHLAEREIDHIITGDTPMPETDARGAALTWLKSQDVDILFQVDADEIYLESDIRRILRFVEGQPFVSAFRLCLKNYFQTPTTYLTDPFCPMRIHRVRAANLEAAAFWADNNVIYGVPGAAPTVRDDSLAVLTVPQSVAWIRHMTWLSDLRSKRKVEYHENHFNSRPSGVRSSYRWDADKGLVFNEAYYQYVGQPLPRVLKD